MIFRTIKTAYDSFSLYYIYCYANSLTEKKESREEKTVNL